MLYIKQLDSLRAIAVFLVITWHWMPGSSFINQFDNGPLGVHVFFVLSGFPITQLLLINKKTVRKDNGVGGVLKKFYVRRALRIFPIYYLTILLTVLVTLNTDVTLPLQELFASLGYILNFYLYSIDKWTDGTPHFWSLAVEEQFYLFWPLIILFTPVKYLLQTVLAFIIVGVISQFMVDGSWFENVLPHTCFDGLGMGALIAWVVEFRNDKLKNLHRLSGIFAIVSTVVIVLVHLNLIQFDKIRFLHSFMGVWIVTYILVNHQRKTFLINLLSNSTLISVGKMSYGIYVYHVLYIIIARKLWNRYIYEHIKTIESPYHEWLFLIINIGPLLFICWLSYKFVEKPILSFKNRFAY